MNCRKSDSDLNCNNCGLTSFAPKCGIELLVDARLPRSSSIINEFLGSRLIARVTEPGMVGRAGWLLYRSILSQDGIDSDQYKVILPDPTNIKNSVELTIQADFIREIIS
jgi:hypothetical protein